MTATTEGAPKLIPLPAPIRDVMAYYSWAFDDDVEWLNQGAGFYRRAEPEQRPVIVIRMADVTGVPRRVLTVLFEEMTTGKLPACDECGADAYLYDPTPLPGGLLRHTFHCRACATQDREPTRWH